MTLNRRAFLTLGAAASTSIALSLATGTAWAQAAFTLEAMERSVDSDYAVSHINVDQLQAMRARLGDDVVLLDVREVDEYAVSHIPGAQQIEPGMSRWRFRRNFADDLAGKQVVFYCSVGVRSSQMAQKMERMLEERGATVHNLRGGVFRIHNDALPLLQSKAGTQTEKIHPYDTYWGQLLTRGPEFYQFKVN